MYFSESYAMADKHAVTMDKIVNLCKTRGIIFPGSEIYGGMAGGESSCRRATTPTAWTPPS